MTWQKIKADLDQENERILNEPCEDVVKLLHYRIIDSRAGTDGQALSAWFFGCTDVRYIVAYLFDLIRLARDPRYTTHQLKFMAKTMIPPLGEFAGYAGFPKLWGYTKPLLDALDEIEDRETVLDIFNSLFLYSSHLNAWIHHYFPWRINNVFPQRTPEEIRQMSSLIK